MHRRPDHDDDSDRVARGDRAGGARCETAETQALERLLNDALRRKGVNELFEKMDELTDANFPPMTMDEIQAEVNAVRAERRTLAAGS